MRKTRTGSTVGKKYDILRDAFPLLSRLSVSGKHETIPKRPFIRRLLVQKQQRSLFGLIQMHFLCPVASSFWVTFSLNTAKAGCRPVVSKHVV